MLDWLLKKRVCIAVDKQLEAEVPRITRSIQMDLEDALESICTNAVMEIFDNVEDRRKVKNYYSSQTIASVSSKFKQATLDAVKEQVKIECAIAMQLEVSNEAFIDKIVERINKKQI